MNKRLIFLSVLLACTLTTRAQWIVHDPNNTIQSIINSANEMIQTSATAENMLNNFQETVKIYQQGKEYYDRLKNVSNLVKNARKVQQAILMVGEISEMYIKNFDKMLADKNFSDKELSAIAAGYTRLLEMAGQELSDLKTFVTPTDLSMTDKERIEMVDKVHSEITRYRNLSAYYTRKNISVSYLRARRTNDLQRVIALYGKDEDKYW